MPLPPADLIIFDEPHRIRGRTREYLVSLYPDAVLVGLTATPCRGDGRGLGNIFETMIQAPQVAELIRLGFLVGARVFAPVDKDIAKGVRIEKGGGEPHSRGSQARRSTGITRVSLLQ